MKMQSENFLFEREINWESPSEGVERQIMGYDEDLMTVKVKFEAGAIGSPHTHPHSQTTYVVNGIFEFTIGDQIQIVKAGDGLYIPPSILHGCKCLESGILIDNFSPTRKDFLKDQ